MVLGIVSTTGVLQRALLPQALLVSTIIVLTGIIVVQVKRYRAEDGSSAIHQHNLYPLLAYLLLVPRAAVLVYDKFIFSPLAVSASSALLLPAMVLMARWAWLFIRIRPQLRALVIFIVVLALGGTLAVFASAAAFLIVLQQLVA